MRNILKHQQQLDRPRAARPGFTILELLIVMGIVGMLAAVSLPALKGLQKANVMESATSQLREDLEFARQKALTGRTTVHVVFVPPTINTMAFSSAGNDAEAGERLKGNAFQAYALFAERTVGDQPGRPFFKYLTPWKTLPDGVIVSAREFQILGSWNATSGEPRPFEYVTIPFPTVYGLSNSVPHVAFDAQGHLVYASGNSTFASEVIELMEASVLVSRAADGTLLDLDVRETGSIEAYNNIVIDGFTGQARVDRPKIQ